MTLRKDAESALRSIYPHADCLPDTWAPLVRRFLRCVMVDGVCVGDEVLDEHGKMTVIAVAKNYVMVRRPGAMPFVKSIKAWKAVTP